MVNEFGRIGVTAARSDTSAYTLKAASNGTAAESEIKFETVKNGTTIVVSPSDPQRRIDIELTLPERSRLTLKTSEGEIRVEGNFEIIEAETNTGTIAVDVPAEEVRYELVWQASRPRFLSDFPLEPVKEKAAGKFQIKGRFEGEKAPGQEKEPVDGEAVAKAVQLKTRTQRGIVLISVPPSEVMADLRERPLTNAAKAIIRSGDIVLMDAIRRAAPKYFGDYTKSLPPVRREPELARPATVAERQFPLKRATVHVTDSFNRAIPGLKESDFELVEAGKAIEVVSVKPVEAPVNLVLLLDVSGSIENYVTFIRKAAREFVDTVDKKDRISIVTFRDDVQVLADFTTDKSLLSASVDSFDAGGPTAYYDALGYALSESLRPLNGERTAIVVLTDGDDNRSFLPFESLIGAIEESGALIYPLYVPSSLIAASAASGFQDIDPLRNRHLTLNSKANGEGERLAKVSGGQYYPITQLSQIQTAYDDIVVQLRTAYDITYRVSDNAADTSGDSEGGRRLQLPRLRVKVKRENAYAQVGPVIPVSDR
ncbi:MAG: VWA domain-containing protein [Pyrinomonadaceae bacterium]|nr:VWA domain-containing protein [Pyrinomonadaceae bacterium]